MSRTREIEDALLEAMIPSPGGGLPAMGELDRAAFWARFDSAAALHVRLGFRAAAVFVDGLARATKRSPFDRLEPAEREAVLERAASLPLADQLIEVAKVVACFAYFDDDGVQDRVRGEVRS